MNCKKLIAGKMRFERQRRKIREKWNLGFIGEIGKTLREIVI